jgi:predicted ester cyclase
VTPEENKASYQRSVDNLNQGDLPASLLFTAPDALFNGEPFGRDGDARRAQMLAQAFPDQHYHIDELIAEGNTMVARWRMTATHLGDLNGPTLTIPATGRSLDIWGLSMYRMHDGMAVEIWERLDMQEFLSQLGALPSAAPHTGQDA